MNKNYTAIAFIIWVLILFVEVFWLYSQIESYVNFTEGLLLPFTVIGVTLVVGSTWFKLFGNTKEE